MVDFSFLIAAYNAEQTITECIDSILNLKNINYEIIIINDGSTDNTKEICEKYASDYNNVFVFSYANSGIATTRYRGIKHANGEYIIFCDSDDKYDTTKLNELLIEAKTELKKYDLICFDFYNVWEKTNIEKTSHYKSDIIELPNSEDKINFLSSSISHSSCGYALWDKIYKRELIEKHLIRAPDKAQMQNRDDWTDDLIINVQYMLFTNSIKILEYPAYLLSKHGSVNDQNEGACVNRISHMTKLFIYIFKFIENNCSQDIIDKFYMIYIWHIKRYIYCDIQKYGIEYLYKEIHDDVNNDFILKNIKLSLKNPQYFKDRWQNPICSEYVSILKYIMTHNTLRFKINNYFLWK